MGPDVCSLSLGESREKKTLSGCSGQRRPDAGRCVTSERDVRPGRTRQPAQDEWVNYTTQRTITANSSNIYVRKSNGPKLEIKWRRCAGGAQGSPVTLPDSDPTDVIRIGQDFLSGTVFCLSARSRGSNETDTWEGIVWWNIHQTPDVPGSAIP